MGWKVRWEKERELSHELYNAGHLYEAAVAHFEATGKRNLLDIALKNADLVCSVFGQDKLHSAPGHEVVDMGLVKLYRVTGKAEYLNTAKYFIEERGHFKGYDASSLDPWKNGAYWQDHIPVVDQKEAIGHSVRAGYLYSAVADIAALTGDKAMLAAIDSIWLNLVSKKLYVQGGAGAIPSGERYGDNYELPNLTAYNETCAAISNVYWNQRMFQLHGESKYIDVLEKILYNGLISGVQLDGKKFFYTNALESRATSTHKSFEGERSGWFECSCCPTNVTRLLPSIPGYMYAQNGRDLFVNLFVNSNTTININQKQVDIKVNGVAVEYKIENGYAIIDKSWNKNDVVEMNLPMDVRRVYSDKLADDIGKVAIQRGPLMYCAEWADNDGKVTNIILPSGSEFTSEFNPNLLNGVTTLKANIQKVEIANNQVNTVQRQLIAIPYYAWANRGKGEMTVWFNEQLKDIDVITKK